jgi:tetratricopeptide (TPR) repeat protein
MAFLGSRRSRIGCAALLFGFFLILAACSGGWRIQLRRAERFERGGQPSSALSIYDALLPLVSRKNTSLIATIERRRGDCLLDLGRVAEAFSAYNKALDANPSDLDARLKLAQLFLAGSAPEKALEYAQVYLRARPGSADALAVVGGSLAATGRIPEAVDSLQRARRLDPHNERIAIALADLYSAVDDDAEARRVLEESVKSDAAHVEAWLALGRLEEQVGNNAAAEVAYRAAVKASNTPQTNLRLAQFLQRTTRTKEAEDILRRVDAMQPARPTALADYELIAGNAQRAEQGYAGALRQAALSASKQPRHDAGNPAQTQAGEIAARLIEAEIVAAAEPSSAPAGAQPQPNPALDRARRQLDEHRDELDPATINVLQAEISLAAADLPMAMIYAQGALAISPASPAAHYIFGETNFRAGERAQARTEWLAALATNDDYAPARMALASLALDQNAPDDAVAFITPVIRHEPGNMRGLVLYARALAMQKRYDAAESVARRAAAVDAVSSTPHLLLGEIALARHELPRSLIEFEQAVILEPHAPDAIDGLTRVYRHGNLGRAMLVHMEEVAGQAPRSATLMEITGRLFADRGWSEDAIRCFRRTLEIDPVRATAAAGLARLLAARGDIVSATEVAAHSGPEPAALVAAMRAHDRGDFHAAIHEYEFAVRHGEHSGIAANNLAWLYAHEGTQLERALSLAYNARDLMPDSPAVQDTIGIVHLARREYSQGVDALEKAQHLLRRLPVDDPQRRALAPQIEQHLAEAYLRAGRSDAAAKLVNR